MRIWRISNYADLSGIGGLKVAGRWHEKGQYVVYAADHPSTALLEVLVHLEIDIEDIPDSFQLLEIDVPGNLTIGSIAITELEKLSINWKGDERITRAQAFPWFQELNSAVLRVPSTIMPGASNFLINPLHADAGRIAIINARKYPYDTRLFGRT